MPGQANVDIDRIPGDPYRLRLTLTEGLVSLSVDMSREEADALFRRGIVMAAVRADLSIYPPPYKCA